MISISASQLFACILTVVLVVGGLAISDAADANAGVALIAMIAGALIGCAFVVHTFNTD